MLNPFQNNDSAFDPMYSDKISITVFGRFNKVNTQTNIPAVVFPIQQIDPFGETEIESQIKIIKVNVRKKDVNVGEISIGDEIMLSNYSKWKVTSVDFLDDCYDIAARSVKNDTGITS